MDIKELISGIEGTCLDYKVSLESAKPRSWLKSVSAFANTKGGCILFGVTDKGHEPVGLADVNEANSKISELIMGRIAPHVNFEITPVEAGNGKVCLAVQIFTGPNCPYYYQHEQTRECYVRHGDRSEPATVAEQNYLILKGSHQTYDALPSSYRIGDVSFTLLGATFKKETAEDFLPDRDLVSMGLITDGGQISFAGVLLCDQGYVRQSRIVCTRWKGRGKGQVDGDALDDEEFSGSSLITLLAGAEAFIRTHSGKPWTIRGMRREEQSDYPFRAVREALVNALIHRDYQIVGTEIHVDMYDDRMEIVSPGGMMNGSRIQELNLRKIPSMRRNEIISDIFGRLRYMDRRGSGISRILNAYAEFDRPPEFYSDTDFFQVTLPNRSAEMLDVSLEKTQLAPEKTQLAPEKTQLAPEKTQLAPENVRTKEEEKEKIQQWMAARAGGRFRMATLDKLMRLRMAYGCEYSFNRDILVARLGIGVNSASRMLQKAVAFGIVRKERKGIYYFVREHTPEH